MQGTIVQLIHFMIPVGKLLGVPFFVWCVALWSCLLMKSASTDQKRGGYSVCSGCRTKGYGGVAQFVYASISCCWCKRGDQHRVLCKLVLLGISKQPKSRLWGSLISFDVRLSILTPTWPIVVIWFQVCTNEIAASWLKWSDIKRGELYGSKKPR